MYTAKDATNIMISHILPRPPHYQSPVWQLSLASLSYAFSIEIRDCLILQTEVQRLFILTFPPVSGFALPHGLAGVERGVDTGVDTAQYSYNNTRNMIHPNLVHEIDLYIIFILT